MVLGYRFTPNWRMTLLAFLAISFFLRLGFWQIDRGDKKKQILHDQIVKSSQMPVDWGSKSKLPTQYQLVRIEGHFLPLTFLLDNQHHNHQFGYHVLSPFMLSDQSVVFVDRGWIPGDVTRKRLPKLNTFQGQAQVTGQAFYPSKKKWLLGPLIETKQPELILIELIDTDEMSKILHKSVYPFIIRLDKGQIGGYVREWTIVNMPPDRHYGYAVQWFAMAFLVLILFIVLNVRRPLH